MNSFTATDIIEGGLHIISQGTIGLNQQIESGDLKHTANLFSLAELKNGDVTFSYQAFDGKGWVGQTQFLNKDMLTIANPAEFARPSGLNRLHQLETVPFGENLLVVTTENKKGKRLPAYTIVNNDRTLEGKPHFFSEANCDLISVVGLPGEQSAMVAYENNWIALKEKQGLSYLMTLKASKTDQPQQKPLANVLASSLNLVRNDDGTFLLSFSGENTVLRWIDPLGEVIAENPEIAKGPLNFLKASSVADQNIIVFYQFQNQPGNVTQLCVFDKRLKLLRETTLTTEPIHSLKLSSIAQNLVLAVYTIADELKASVFNANGDEMQAITITGSFTGTPSAFDVLKFENGRVAVVFTDDTGRKDEVRWVQITYRP